MDTIASLVVAPGFGAGLAALLVLWGCTALASTILFVVVGLTLDALNARHPERRIQERTHPHKWRELRTAPQSILTLSFWFALGLFCQFRGWTMAPLAASWWSVPVMLGLSIVLYDAWFYWGHRLMHLKSWWWIHALHHKSLVPTPWSNNHDSILDSTICQLYFAIIPFIIPIPWQVLIIHKIFDQTSGMVGHCGYEHFASPLARKPWPLSSTVYHDLHHSRFNYNYAHTFTVWDRLFGTLHPDTDKIVAQFETNR